MPEAVPRGVERQALHLILKGSQRYRPVVLFLGPGPLVAELRDKGISVYAPKDRLDLKHLWRVRGAVSMGKAVVEKEAPAIIHSFTSTAQVVGGKLAKRFRLPSIFFQHRPSEYGATWAGWYPPMLQLVPSEYVKSGLAKRRRALAEVVPNATDLFCAAETQDKHRRDVSERWGLGEDSLVIGMSTSLAPGRGIEVALSAISSIAMENRRIRVLLVGEPPAEMADYGREVGNIAREEGLENHIVLTGFQSELEPLISRFDIFVEAATVPHGFGHACLEAMAMGKAVVAPRHGGIPELVSDGVDGILHQPGDAYDLSQKLRDLLGSAERRESLGSNARLTVENKFLPRFLIEKVEGIYDRLLTRAFAEKQKKP